VAKHKNGKKRDKGDRREPPQHRLHPDTKKSIWAIIFAGCGVVLGLAYVRAAGPAGEFLYGIFAALLGDWGYLVLPASLLLMAGTLLMSGRTKVLGVTSLGGGLLVLSVLGLINLLADPAHAGYAGYVLGSLRMPFGFLAAVVLNFAVLLAAILMTLNVPLRFGRRTENIPEPDEDEEEDGAVEEPQQEKKTAAEPDEDADDKEEEVVIAESKERRPLFGGKPKPHAPPKFVNYVAPPLDLLKAAMEKPTTGDLRGNANIIKRTLESFGIPVEMGEVNVGPKVTRYTLKPAEGVKLSRIVALNQDLALALAAHPIRIEAPIPGKSLVGIEVPNKAAALVRLGSLMAYPEFHAAGPLGFILGRDVTGEPLYANLEKMPHLLIAGATGSGKSVMIHTLVLSMLYKNSPANLKFVMIDPKRVELTIYQNIPHLVSAVVTENKKAISVFRWAISEMERRYELLQGAGSRDITSYNKNGGKNEPLPYIVIIVDELADLMTSYGREVEGSIVRLAQMARATGIHLVLTTQRPSVEVITGLIKANITGRIALQVASQIDSRTILDTSGAEKLLGGGDLLFQSAELSKPKRIQGAYVSEEEITTVASFIREHNLGGADTAEEVGVDFAEGGASAGAGAALGTGSATGDVFEEFAGASGDDDELYEEAVAVVSEAQKASASLLQRRLSVGYARAARLLDLMEERGVVGPGEGAKPREVFVEKPAPE
jgi:S-DNA-T family DNA segregation ATPase FtsK/SpoIIIE